MSADESSLIMKYIERLYYTDLYIICEMFRVGFNWEISHRIKYNPIWSTVNLSGLYFVVSDVCYGMQISLIVAI
jgi:hypothetical protein